MVSVPQPEVGNPGFRVIWTRGEGCLELAALLAPSDPLRATGDLREACIEARADLLVARRFSSFDLASVAVPHAFDPDLPTRVVALVGTGPHSALAGRVAATLGDALGVSAGLATAYRSADGREAAAQAIEAISSDVGLAGETVQADRAAGLVSHLGERTLLIFGAAGGWLLQRNLYGPGVRLRAHAPVGAVVVRAAQARVFQRMAEPVFFAAYLGVRDAAALVDLPVVPVVDEGRLVGVVERTALIEADPEATVADLMAAPASVRLDASMNGLAPVAELFRGGPVPVTDDDDRLVGSVHPDGDVGRA